MKKEEKNLRLWVERLLFDYCDARQNLAEIGGMDQEDAYEIFQCRLLKQRLEEFYGLMYAFKTAKETEE